MITFTVFGRPYPQGSKRAFTDKRGQARMTEGSGLEFAAWRNAVTDAALRARFDHPPITAPVSVDATFRFAMPKSRGRAALATGMGWRQVAPDLDKLQRAIGDALTAAKVIGSDAQIAQWIARKIEVVDIPEGVDIIICELSSPVLFASHLTLVGDRCDA